MSPSLHWCDRRHLMVPAVLFLSAALHVGVFFVLKQLSWIRKPTPHASSITVVTIKSQSREGAAHRSLAAPTKVSTKVQKKAAPVKAPRADAARFVASHEAEGAVGGQRELASPASVAMARAATPEISNQTTVRLRRTHAFSTSWLQGEDQAKGQAHGTESASASSSGSKLAAPAAAFVRASLAFDAYSVVDRLAAIGDGACDVTISEQEADLPKFVCTHEDLSRAIRDLSEAQLRSLAQWLRSESRTQLSVSITNGQAHLAAASK